MRKQDPQHETTEAPAGRQRSPESAATEQEAPIRPGEAGTPAGLYRLQGLVGNAAATRQVADATVQRSGARAATSAGPDSVREAVGSPATPVRSDLRTQMESVLGTDLSGVRLHTGPIAQRSAAAMSADAYTTGKHIVADRGKLTDHVLRHELAHVGQQSAGPVSGTDNGHGVQVSNPRDHHEVEAEEIAHHADRLAARSRHDTDHARSASSARSEAAVQRYAVDETGQWKVSQNGRMAVPATGETRDFFAVPAIITFANNALERKGSPLRFREGGAVPAELAALGMRRAVPVFQVPGGEEKTDDDLLDVNECIAVAQVITGDKMSQAIFRPAEGGPSARSELRPNEARDIYVYPELLSQPGMVPEELERQLYQSDGAFRFVLSSIGAEPVRIDTVIDDEEEARDEVVDTLVERGISKPAARGLLAALTGNTLEFYPSLQQLVINRATELLANPGAATAKEIRDQLKPLIDDVTTLRNIKIDSGRGGRGSGGDVRRNEAYEDASAENRASMAGRFGINEAAQPHVGEAFSIYSTRPETDAEIAAATAATRSWKYHFAAVVARDGDDAVTLENYNRQLAGVAGNSQYYFAMYGRGEGQSFHDIHQGTVSGALTLVAGDKAHESRGSTPDLEPRIPTPPPASLTSASSADPEAAAAPTGPRPVDQGWRRVVASILRFLGLERFIPAHWR